jgi:hypothetical protein
MRHRRSPWIIEKNFRRPEQIPTAILVFGAVSLIALLFWSAAIHMHRRKSIGRTLALIAAPITMFAFWPIGNTLGGSCIVTAEKPFTELTMILKDITF